MTTSPKSPDDDLRALAERIIAVIADGREIVPDEVRVAAGFLALLNERDALRAELEATKERLAEAERERDEARHAGNQDTLRWWQAYNVAVQQAQVNGARAETAEAALASQKARGDRLEEALYLADGWLASIDSHLYDSEQCRKDRQFIRTALAQSERTP